MSALSQQERVVYITQCVEMEVDNGGFCQYFYNSYGDFANEVVAAFTEMGATKIAEICRKAMSIYGEKVPADQDEREAFLLDNDEIEDVINECDDAFYENEEELTEISYRYIMKNREAFT